MTSTTATKAPAKKAPVKKATPKKAAPKAKATEVASTVRGAVAKPASGAQAVSLLDLFYLGKEDLKANMQSLSMLESYSTTEVEAMSLKDLRDSARASILQADMALEAKAAAEDTTRERGDVDAYFGFTELPKGFKAYQG